MPNSAVQDVFQKVFKYWNCHCYLVLCLHADLIVFVATLHAKDGTQLGFWEAAAVAALDRRNSVNSST